MKFADWLIERVALRRAPDFIIGGDQDPYLLRWWLIPRNPVFNIYLHLFLRSDDDRALHDHPWANCSILLEGQYREHTPEGFKDFKAGDWKFRRSGKMAHRIELTHGSCWTMFITGPRVREWGFLCQRGWVHWKDFTDSRDSGAIGRGCDA